MDQVSLVQEAQCIQQLLRKHPHEGRTQTPELILLDELVEVDTEQLKCQAQMLTMDEGVFQPKEMMVIILVVLAVEL